MKNTACICLVFLCLSVGVQAQSRQATDMINWQNSILRFAQNMAHQNMASINSKKPVAGITPKMVGELTSFLTLSQATYSQTGKLVHLKVEAHLNTVYPKLMQAYRRYTQKRIMAGNRPSVVIPQVIVPPNK